MFKINKNFLIFLNVIAVVILGGLNYACSSHSDESSTEEQNSYQECNDQDKREAYNTMRSFLKDYSPNDSLNPNYFTSELKEAYLKAKNYEDTYDFDETGIVWLKYDPVLSRNAFHSYAIASPTIELLEGEFITDTKIEIDLGLKFDDNYRNDYYVFQLSKEKDKWLISDFNNLLKKSNDFINTVESALDSNFEFKPKTIEQQEEELGPELTPEEKAYLEWIGSRQP